MSPRRSLLFVSIWISTAIVFAFGLWYYTDSQHFVEFLTCYVIEWSLSLDNLFVFLMIFRSFGVVPHNQLRVLEWGIIGAIVLRLGFILIGVKLVALFNPILYFFGALLLISAYRMAFSKEEHSDIQKNKMVAWMRRRFAITKNYYGDKFFIRKAGRIFGTPMVLVLVTIESSDIMFAIDSIPAAFAITQKPFIIFTANMFAILGLRSLYFLLAHAENMFSKLRYGVTIILAFVGAKIILDQLGFHLGHTISLGVVVVCIGGSILLSLITDRKKEG